MKNYERAVKYFEDRRAQLSEAYSHDWLNEDGVIAYKVADAIAFLGTFATNGEEMAKMLEEEADQVERELFIKIIAVDRHKVADELRNKANGFRRIGG